LTWKILDTKRTCIKIFLRWKQKMKKNHHWSLHHSASCRLSFYRNQCSKKIQHIFFYGETPPIVLVSGGEALKTTTRAVCRALIDCTDRSYNGFLRDSGEPFSGKFMNTTRCVPSPRESYGCLMDTINATTIRSWGDLINI
jgi:hypothetical protein